MLTDSVSALTSPHLLPLRRSRLARLVEAVAQDGEALDGPDMQRELMLVSHRGGYLVPASVCVKDAIDGEGDALELLVVFWPLALAGDEGYIVLRDDGCVLSMTRSAACAALHLWMRHRLTVLPLLLPCAGAYKLLGLAIGDLASGSVAFTKWQVAAPR